VRLQLFALAYNLANFLRSLVLPDQVAHWSLTTLREKLVKIGARIVRHSRYLIFQLAEVAVPRSCVGSSACEGRPWRRSDGSEPWERPEPRGEPCAEINQQDQSSPDRPADWVSASPFSWDPPQNSCPD
jgi:hypothetical protein